MNNNWSTIRSLNMKNKFILSLNIFSNKMIHLQEAFDV